MPDLAMRFATTMLTLSTPFCIPEGVCDSLAYTLLFERESLDNDMRIEACAQAALVCTPTYDMTPARLAHGRMEKSVEKIAHAAFEVVKAIHPQHIVVEIGPCGLPLDSSSATSKAQTTEQYKRAIQACIPFEYDAIFLNGMRSYADMECAISAAKELTSFPVIASIPLDEQGNFDGLAWHDARLCMNEADVWGFESAAPLADVCDIAAVTTHDFKKPLLVQLKVERFTEQEEKLFAFGRHVPHKNYPTPDILADAVPALQQAGVQFLRATGQATSAYTAALAVMSAHMPVKQ